MANITKKKTDVVSFEPKRFKENISFRSKRSQILGYLMWKFALTKNSTSLITLSKEDLVILSSEINFSYPIINKFVNDFFWQLKHFKRFLHNCKIKYASGTKKALIYLHKIYKLLPVFDYRRAKANLKTLYKLCSRENFWPSISTQLAIVIYITDKLDKNKQKQLMQKNIRTICNCSAYAFHEAKNNLNIDKIIWFLFYSLFLKFLRSNFELSL